MDDDEDPAPYLREPGETLTEYYDRVGKQVADLVQASADLFATTYMAEVEGAQAPRSIEEVLRLHLTSLDEQIGTLVAICARQQALLLELYREVPR